MHGLFVFIRVENSPYYEGGDYMNKFQWLGIALMIGAATCAVIGCMFGARRS